MVVGAEEDRSKSGTQRERERGQGLDDEASAQVSLASSTHNKQTGKNKIFFLRHNSKYLERK